MFYSFNETVLKLDNSEIFCNSVKFGVSANADPVYEEGSNSTVKFVSSPSPAVGTCHISYFLTGEDPLISDVMGQASPHSIDIGGIALGDAYLTKYDFSADPYSAISVNVSFSFFGEPAGEFETGRAVLPEEAELLTVSNIDLVAGVNHIDPDTIYRLRYGYSILVEPNYVIESHDSPVDHVGIQGVVLGNKEAEAQFSLYNYGVNVPLSGVADSLTINLKNKQNQITNTFYMDGRVIKKDMDVKAGNRLTSDFVMIQGTAGGAKPSLDNPAFTAQGWPGEEVVLNGSNMSAVDGVSFMNHPCEITTAASNSVTITIPRGVPNSGVAPFVVRSPGGDDMTSTSLKVTGDGTLDLF